MSVATTTPPRELLTPPPSERNTPVGWLRKNLFSSWLNTLLTILSLGLIYLIVRPLLSWALNAADWAVIPANLNLLMRGRYPAAEAWRIWASVDVLAVIVGLTAGLNIDRPRTPAFVIGALPLLLLLMPFVSNEARLDLLVLEGCLLAAFALARFGPRRAINALIVPAWVLYFPLLIYLVRGLGLALPVVETQYWGGLVLSLMLAAVGIALSFPLGVLLALGRRSSLPAIRTLCVIYIEFIRGVPLITLLFFAVVALQLFLPQNSPPINSVLRVTVAITLFSAAYTAENVRGGLQSIPKGQNEAAIALGLNGFQSMFFIVLPQALRAVIPVLVGQFIGLFKDTSLVALVGLFDLLCIARAILSNPNWIGRAQEIYLFLGVVYWIFCYAMAYASRRIERSLGVGER